MKKIKEGLNKNQTVLNLNLNAEETALIKDLNLLTIKPIIYIINIDEKKTTNHSNIIVNDHEHKNQIFICAKLEAELADLEEKEAEKYLKEYGLKESGIKNLITCSYGLLDLITFFTCQNKILQAWTVPKNSTALQAAGKIHTDFAQKFIRAEIIKYQNLIEQGSEQKTREKGLIQIQGKKYLIQDGDIIHFK